MKQRILVAQAIMGDPRIVILDEPTAGLDPKERVRLRDKLSELADNRIILVATHVVSDIQTISKEIIIIKNGKLVTMDTPAKLLERYAKGGDLEEVYMQIFGEEEEQ
jgi:ABC-type multidrug transport system ATPase subunit